MNDTEVAARLSELGIELPPPPKPAAAYVPVRIAGTTLHVAGQVPMQDGAPMSPGHLGDDVSVDEGRAAARLAALQALSAIREALGGFGRLERIVQVTVYIAAAPGFVDHPVVANGASEVLADVLGEPGEHARAAVGMTSLPLGACVEVQVTAQLES